MLCLLSAAPPRARGHMRHPRMRPKKSAKRTCRGLNGQGRVPLTHPQMGKETRKGKGKQVSAVEMLDILNATPVLGDSAVEVPEQTLTVGRASRRVTWFAHSPRKRWNPTRRTWRSRASTN
jgi:hypothetical protein